MTKKQLEETVEALAVQYSTKQVLLVARYDGNLIHEQNIIWLKDDFRKALGFMRIAPDFELHYVIGEQTKSDNNKSFKAVHSQLLIPKKPQAKIDAFYARNSDNLKYTDDDYFPSVEDELELSGGGRIPMNELVLYASRNFRQSASSAISKHKIYKHLGTGVLYCLSAAFHVTNLTKRIAAGETEFTGKPTKLEVFIDYMSDEELTDCGFTVYHNQYRTAKRKHSIGGFLASI